MVFSVFSILSTFERNTKLRKSYFCLWCMSHRWAVCRMEVREKKL